MIFSRRRTKYNDPAAAVHMRMYEDAHRRSCGRHPNMPIAPECQFSKQTWGVGWIVTVKWKDGSLRSHKAELFYDQKSNLVDCEFNRSRGWIW